MHALHIDNIIHRFGKTQVLTDVSLNIEEGEFFGLIGLNGIGKTTLIKIILDLLHASEGNVDIFGVSSKDVSSREKLVYLPEKFHPSQYLKGHEYLSLSLAYYGLSYDKKKGEEEAERLDLKPEALSNLIGSYSKGMGQKLGLLGTIMADRDLLILDEPMSGLDPRARALLKTRLLELKKEGKTLFFSSHILTDIDEICDRITVLDKGEIRFTGTPEALRKQHKNASLEEAFLASIADNSLHEKMAS